MSNKISVILPKVIEGEIVKWAPRSVEFSNAVNGKTPPVPKHGKTWVEKVLHGEDRPLIIDHETGQRVGIVRVGDLLRPNAL